jgi:hypothetical protein
MPAVRAPLRYAGVVAVFLAGLLGAAVLATAGSAQESTTTETTTVVETTTEPATTVVQTETMEQTTTHEVTVAPTTTAGEQSSSGTPTWVWVLLAVLAVGLVAALVALLAGRRGGGVPVEARQRQLQGAVGSWVAQGWAVESQTADSAVLVRAGERMLLTVDPNARIATQRLQ